VDVNPSRAKRNFFEIIGSQFYRCAAPGDKHIWTRIIHRQGDDIPAIVNVDSGWHGVQVETIERTWDGGAGEQFIVETDEETCRTKCFLNWETVARTAGNELSRVLLTSHLLGSEEGKANFPHGVCGWLLAMGRLYEAGELSLPIQTGYVDQNTWLNACDANSRANDPSEQEKDLYRAQFNELWAKTLQIGKEYVCEDTITASVLFAKWLSDNDWPFVMEKERTEVLDQVRTITDQANTDHAKQERNDWLLDQRGMGSKPKMTEKELSDALADACKKHVNWVHIEPRSISSALREAYTRKTGAAWPFDGRGRKPK
jgi:hypothetical protein